MHIVLVKLRGDGGSVWSFITDKYTFDKIVVEMTIFLTDFYSFFRRLCGFNAGRTANTIMMMLLMTVFVFQIFGGPRAEHANHRRSMVEPINMEIPMDYEDDGVQNTVFDSISEENNQ